MNKLVLKRPTILLQDEVSDNVRKFSKFRENNIIQKKVISFPPYALTSRLNFVVDFVILEGKGVYLWHRIISTPESKMTSKQGIRKRAGDQCISGSYEHTKAGQKWRP